MQEEYDSLLKNRTWPRATWFHGGGNTLLEYFFEGSLLEYYETSSYDDTGESLMVLTLINGAKHDRTSKSSNEVGHSISIDNLSTRH